MGEFGKVHVAPRLTQCLAAALLLGCTVPSTQQRPYGSPPWEIVADFKYGLVLESVHRPADALARYGEGRIVQVPGEGATFTDGMVETLWYIGYGMLNFLLINKASGRLSVDWDDAEMLSILEPGIREPVLHLGTQLGSTMPAKSSTTDLSRGRDIVNSLTIERYLSRGLDLFPQHQFGDTINTPATVYQQFRGKRFRLLVPFRIDDGPRNDYIFDFRIASVSATPRSYDSRAAEL
jgi:hypothetical protein